MLRNLQEREAAALKSVSIAEEWRMKSVPRMELTCLSSAVRSLLGVSVVLHDNPSDGIEYLIRQGVAASIQRIATLNEGLFRALHSSSSPPTAAVDNNITPVHIAWLVGEWDAARSLLTICTDHRVSEHFPLTRFWSEYHRAIDCLTSQQQYSPQVANLRGYERYWSYYLALISDLTHARDTAATLQEISHSFAVRNKDTRHVDHAMIDGDGEQPVKWDFRTCSILKYWNTHHQIHA